MEYKIIQLRKPFERGSGRQVRFSVRKFRIWYTNPLQQQFHINIHYTAPIRAALIHTTSCDIPKIQSNPKDEIPLQNDTHPLCIMVGCDETNDGNGQLLPAKIPAQETLRNDR